MYQMLCIEYGNIQGVATPGKINMELQGGPNWKTISSINQGFSVSMWIFQGVSDQLALRCLLFPLDVILFLFPKNSQTILPLFSRLRRGVADHLSLHYTLHLFQGRCLITCESESYIKAICKGLLHKEMLCSARACERVAKDAAWRSSLKQLEPCKKVPTCSAVA